MIQFILIYLFSKNSTLKILNKNVDPMGGVHKTTFVNYAQCFVFLRCCSVIFIFICLIYTITFFVGLHEFLNSLSLPNIFLTNRTYIYDKAS